MQNIKIAATNVIRNIYRTQLVSRENELSLAT